MKRSTFKKRALASVLALTMAASVLPAAGFATGEGTVPSTGGREGSDGLYLNKTAKLEDDGTYTINLEAYATGEVTVETSTMVKPTDIVLVLDQSGSMTDRDHYISGIPTGNYTRVNGNVTIKQVADGGYYYRATDGEYYRLRVDQETLESTTTWVGADGNTYTANQVSNTWKDYYGYTWELQGGYYAVPTLKTFHRAHDWGSYYYVNDKDSNETSSRQFDAGWARSAFLNQFGQDPYDAQAVDRNDQYAGAQYIPVTQQTVTTYSYTFYYVDANGEKMPVGEPQTGSETDVCNVSPLYTQQTTRGPRLDALEYAAETFIESIRANAVANDVDHRVAVVGFASDDMDGTQWEGQREYYWCNTELFVGSTQYNYAQNGAGSNGRDVASNHYDEAFQDVRSTQGYTNLENSIKSLAGKGATYPQYGFDMASGVFNANGGSEGEQGRARVVIFLTDGEPGASGYDRTAANSAVSSATTVKNTYGATVYTVAVLSSAPSTGSDVDQFLKNTSSSGTYTLATNAQELENFFETVDDEITSTTTTVDLTKDAILKDVLGSDFTFPADYDVQQNVTVQKAKYEGEDSFAVPEPVTGTEVELVGDTIDVSGFDYVATENLVTEDGGVGNTPTGYKLIVTIKGVLAKDTAAGKGEISTNSEASGIYDKNSTNGELTMIKAFDQPKVSIGSSIYVLDYAKEATLPVDTMTRVNRLDSSSDQVFSQVDESATSLSMEYGNAEVKDNALTYEPKTMNWNGYDTFYALGKDGSNVNQWSKISVMPANNVYYEDDFVTTDADGGKVGIEYTGTWEIDGSSAGNTETPNTEIHGGWVDGDTGLSDDTGYSDGSAHKSSTKNAKATFTFTGTGVDVYGYTDMTTGIVRAQLYRVGEDESKALSKVLIVDTQSESSGEKGYYQIPTLYFSGLDYGTYEVVLTVGSTSDNRSTFYLDGIRVYNPIQGPEVNAAYGENEADAVFKSVRDILLDSETLTADTEVANGVVFIDKVETETGTSTNVIGTYKDYGPKNEVYLAQGQAIAFVLTGFEDGSSVYVGLKSPTGVATTAVVTNGASTSECKVNHTTDLYYQVTPTSDGLVVIKNNGPALLSVTKLRTTDNAEVGEAGVASLMSYMSIMDTLPEVPYGEAPVEETPGTSQGEGSVDIVNPDQDQSQETPTQGNTFMDFLKDIFESLWGLF